MEEIITEKQRKEIEKRCHTKAYAKLNPRSNIIDILKLNYPVLTRDEIDSIVTEVQGDPDFKEKESC